MVIQLGFPPQYVLDEMQPYEIKTAFEYSYLKNKDDWEQTRWMICALYQVNSKNKIKINDVANFPWEDVKDDEDTSITKKDIERLKNNATNYLKYIQNAE